MSKQRPLFRQMQGKITLGTLTSAPAKRMFNLEASENDLRARIFSTCNQCTCTSAFGLQCQFARAHVAGLPVDFREARIPPVPLVTLSHFVEASFRSLTFPLAEKLVTEPVLNPPHAFVCFFFERGGEGDCNLYYMHALLAQFLLLLVINNLIQ